MQSTYLHSQCHVFKYKKAHYVFWNGGRDRQRDIILLCCHGQLTVFFQVLLYCHVHIVYKPITAVHLPTENTCQHLVQKTYGKNAIFSKTSIPLMYTKNAIIHILYAQTWCMHIFRLSVIQIYKHKKTYNLFLLQHNLFLICKTERAPQVINYWSPGL